MVDLSALVRRVHDKTNLTDHRVVAKQIRQLIPDEDLEGAFEDALTVYVRVMFSLFRGSQQKPEQPPRSPRSAKRDGIREWWRYRLHTRYATADGQKILRDFTREDCLYQAAQDRRKAAELSAQADRWDALAARLQPGQTVGMLL